MEDRPGTDRPLVIIVRAVRCGSPRLPLLRRFASCSRAQVEAWAGVALLLEFLGVSSAELGSGVVGISIHKGVVGPASIGRACLAF